tara:strand:+ start:617 stop:862 length:246 start_codon:yes stop_codon:yes gene_type:complete
MGRKRKVKLTDYDNDLINLTFTSVIDNIGGLSITDKQVITGEAFDIVSQQLMSKVKDSLVKQTIPLEMDPEIQEIEDDIPF